MKVTLLSLHLLLFFLECHGDSKRFIVSRLRPGEYSSSEEACHDLLTRQRISERVFVQDCKLVQRSAQPIHGIYIGQYRIQLRKRLRYYRVPAYILRELNRGLPNCRYDGYWASTEIQTSFLAPWSV
ncbi:hypothetical protein CLF_102693 [Clonorchis sinensis]|uniref:Uncharacterized protein n=1 Tax=Clonorchis sinensis TaxID=79923 RepID=G7Y8D0_CLOSI|nr:hypothetical protein CLF_102693 [Clonorchis sinensis]